MQTFNIVRHLSLVLLIHFVLALPLAAQPQDKPIHDGTYTMITKVRDKIVEQIKESDYRIIANERIKNQDFIFKAEMGREYQIVVFATRESSKTCTTVYQVHTKLKNCSASKYLSMENWRSQVSGDVRVHMDGVAMTDRIVIISTPNIDYERHTSQWMTNIKAELDQNLVARGYTAGQQRATKLNGKNTVTWETDLYPGNNYAVIALTSLTDHNVELLAEVFYKDPSSEQPAQWMKLGTTTSDGKSYVLTTLDFTTQDPRQKIKMRFTAKSASDQVRPYDRMNIFYSYLSKDNTTRQAGQNKPIDAYYTGTR